MEEEEFPYAIRQSKSSENDPSILAVIYNREKRKRLDEMDKLRNDLGETFPNFLEEFGETLEEFILEQTKKTLVNLKEQVYGKPTNPPPNERSHLWIGINPPPNTITLKCLWEKALSAFSKYKCLATHASCAEAYTDNGYRPHLHILAVSGEKPGRVITALANHFSLEKNSIECKAYHKGLLFGEHYDYIVGSKTASKSNNVLQDQLERAKFEIPDFLQNIFSDNIKKACLSPEKLPLLNQATELKNEDDANIENVLI